MIAAFQLKQLMQSLEAEGIFQDPSFCADLNTLDQLNALSLLQWGHQFFSSWKWIYRYHELWTPYSCSRKQSKRQRMMGMMRSRCTSETPPIVSLPQRKHVADRCVVGAASVPEATGSERPLGLRSPFLQGLIFLF